MALRWSRTKMNDESPWSEEIRQNMKDIEPDAIRKAKKDLAQITIEIALISADKEYMKPKSAVAAALRKDGVA